MTTIRSFVCVELPAAERERIGELQERLRAHRARVSWVAPANVHVTLAFLGDVDASRVPEISTAIERASAGTAPLRLWIDGAGAFPSLARPRVLWAGLGGATRELGSLQARVTRELAGIGFVLEDRPFKPHLTIGRVKDVRDPSLRPVAGDLSGADLRGEEFEVSDVVLMRSELDPRGARYTPLARVGLARPDHG